MFVKMRGKEMEKLKDLANWKLKMPELPATMNPELTQALQELTRRQRQNLPGSLEQSRRTYISTIEVIEKFIASKRLSVTPTSLGSYRGALRAFARHYPVLPTEPEPIEEYLGRYSSDNTGARSVYGVLHVMYDFAEKRLSLPNPMAKIDKPRGKPKPPQHLSFNQAKALLGAIRDDRERGLVYCLFGLGLRLKETRLLTVADIGEDIIQIRGKERDEPIPLLTEIRETLLKLADGKQPQAPIFRGRQGQGPLSDSQIQNIIKDLFVRAEIKGVRASPHTLRHSKGVLSTILGLDQFSNKRLLRHASTEMTDRYNELNLEELKIKDRQYNPLLRILNKPELGKKPDYAQG